MSEKVNHSKWVKRTDGKNSNVKKLLVDYQATDDCINSDSYGAVCVKCGRCGRTFTKDGFLKESENND